MIFGFVVYFIKKIKRRDKIMGMLPLEGIKVVELAAVVAAPTAGRLLAEFGAEVIKVEPPKKGDMLRNLGEMHYMPIEDYNNPLFDTYNTGKKLVAVNLKSEEGMEILMKLLEDADVLLTNTRMRSMEKMGLGYDELKKRFPKLIYAHFSGFGLDGPDRDRPGFDTTAFWMRTGAPLDIVLDGQFPARATYAMGDIASASYLLNGILMAIIGREKSGHGTLISTSLFNAGIWANGPYVVNTQYGHQLPEDRYEPWSPFSDYYQCSDGKWIAPFAKMYVKDRPMLAEVFGIPELVTDPDMENVSKMKKTGKIRIVTEKLEKIIAQKDSKEWSAIFEQNDIPYEIIRHIKDIKDDEQAWANGFVETVKYPDRETVMPVPPIKYSDYEKREFKITGPIGEDTNEVIGKLGYTPEYIDELKNKGVIQ